MKRLSQFPIENRLTARGLESLRGCQCLFRDLSLSLASGEGLHVKGANGSGKTTLLRILCGLRLAESGAILWNETDIHYSITEYHASLCYLGHKSALKDELTPHENLTIWAALHGRDPEKTAITESLEMVGITPYQERPCRTLSAGQRQRVALARVMLSETPLWFLDEPATALDDSGVRLLNTILQAHLERGGLLLITSHQRLNDSLPLHEIRLSGSRD